MLRRIPVYEIPLGNERSRRQATDGGDNSTSYEYVDFYDVYDTAEKVGGDDDEGGHQMRGLPSSVYCDLAATARTACAQSNLLEVWNFDEAAIKGLTKEDILRDIHETETR